MVEYAYSISKRMEIAGAHQLCLDYDSKCTNIHGHNWIVTVYCGANQLNHNGMIIDFKQIKNIVSDKLDHRYINSVLSDINPTAENIAAWILTEMNNKLKELNAIDGSDSVCYRVTVQESEGNIACCTFGGCGGRL